MVDRKKYRESWVLLHHNAPLSDISVLIFAQSTLLIAPVLPSAMLSWIKAEVKRGVCTWSVSRLLNPQTLKSCLFFHSTDGREQTCQKLCKWFLINPGLKTCLSILICHVGQRFGTCFRDSLLYPAVLTCVGGPHLSESDLWAAVGPDVDLSALAAWRKADARVSKGGAEIFSTKEVSSLSHQ